MAIALCMLVSAPATASAERGLTAQETRPVVDSLIVYTASGRSTARQVGDCVQVSLLRIDCEAIDVEPQTGAATCRDVIALARRDQRMRYGVYPCPLPAGRVPSVALGTVPRAVLTIASRPVDVLVSCPAGLPGCPTEADLPRCDSRLDCAPLRVDYCGAPSPTCPTIRFGRCPADPDACPGRTTQAQAGAPCDTATTDCTVPPPSRACVRDAAMCAEQPVVDCADQPLSCAAVPVEPCAGPLECAPVVDLLGCATALTPCAETVRPANQGEATLSSVKPGARIACRRSRITRISRGRRKSRITQHCGGR